MLRFGLVAEEVAEVNPDLVGRDAKGQVQTVHYEAVNAMLLNEFLKEHRKVEGLETTFVQQRKDFEAALARQQKDFQATAAYQQKQIETLTAGLQKVSAQLEANTAAPQVVRNP
jgi:surfactin synthase thioesterase subunit